MAGRLLNAAPADGLVINERVVPLSFRVAGLIFIVAAAVGVLGAHRIGTSVPGIVALALALVCAVLARTRTRSVALLIDRTGAHSPDGRRNTDWDDAALIWVGPAARVASGSSLLIYTRSGIDATRKARTRLKPAESIRLPNAWPSTEVCSRLRLLTDVPVLDGAVIDRQTAELQIMGTE